MSSQKNSNSLKNDSDKQKNLSRIPSYKNKGISSSIISEKEMNSKFYDKNYCKKNTINSSNNSTKTTILSSNRSSKKKVTFNENVEIIMIKSYKNYYIEKEEESIRDYFDENYNYRPKKRKKEGVICQCIIN